MLRSAVTISLVQEARGGPFVYWDDLLGSVSKAAERGFDAVEIFAPEPAAVDAAALQRQLDETGLAVAAVGTGAGWLRKRLTLTSPSPETRQHAVDFIRSIIDLGAKFEAPAIIGSMQGRWGEGVDRETALGWLRDGLNELGGYALQLGVPLIYEPLNRYETNLCNTVESGVALLQTLDNDNVRLLADLFHMNIEEADIAAALRAGGRHIGHIHFVDSNRRPAGCGHIDYAPILAALRDIGYAGYLSAEAFAWPDSDAAARQTIETYRRLVSP
jgi:sugar phosphate isomerase/epimerase